MSGEAEKEGPPAIRQGRLQTVVRGLRTRVAALGIGAMILAAVLGFAIPKALSTGSKAVGEVVRREQPVVVTVLQPGEYQSETFYSPNYLMTRSSPQDAPTSAAEDSLLDFDRWARQNGGVPGQEQALRLEIRGREDRPVIINGIRARVVSKRDPLEGWFTNGRECGGTEIREALIDLDATPPSAKFSNVDPRDPSREVLAFNVQVSAKDVEVVDVVARTQAADVRWELEVLYSAAGKHGMVVVNDKGRPFEVTALTPGRAKFYSRNAAGAFLREPDGDPSAKGFLNC